MDGFPAWTGAGLDAICVFGRVVIHSAPADHHAPTHDADQPFLVAIN
jgi:hypothetical protein